MRKTAIFLLFALFVPSAAAIGVAPSVVNAGTIRPGEVQEVTVYVMSSRDSPFRVKPQYDEPLLGSVYSGDMFRPSEFSGQDISSWIHFRQDSFLITPSNTTTAFLSDGTAVRSNGAINFYIRVPEDAEPGYHAGTIDLNPQLRPESGGEIGTIVVGQAVMQFYFRVPGQANRRLTVQDVRAYRTGRDKVRVDMVVRNTGTVTTALREGRLKIFNGDNRLELIRVGGRELRPGEFATLTGYWRGGVSGGNFQVETNISWATGGTTMTGALSIPDQIEIVPSGDAPGQGGTPGDRKPLPLWLVVMSLVVLAVLMYSFEIAPVWIFATVGLAGISAFIALSGVSNLLLVLPLIIFAATVYLV